MKSHATRIAVRMTVAAGLLLSFGSWNQAAATGSFICNNRTIQGTAGTNLTGFVTPDGVTQIPFAEVGIFKLDGKGSLTGSDSVSTGGSTAARQFTGTYAVAPDCSFTATATENVPGAMTSHFSGTIVNGGDGSYLMSTDPGTTISGSSRRVGSLFFGN